DGFGGAGLSVFREVALHVVGGDPKGFRHGEPRAEQQSEHDDNGVAAVCRQLHGPGNNERHGASQKSFLAKPFGANRLQTSPLRALSRDNSEHPQTGGGCSGSPARSFAFSERFTASGFRTCVLTLGLAMLTACRNLTGEG